MTTFVSHDVQAGLDAARRAERPHPGHLRVKVDGQTYPVLRAWATGFAMPAKDAPHLRGLVDLYDGARHVSRCLVVASEEQAGERRYDLKLVNHTGDTPPADFARPDDAPVALIGEG